LYGATLYAAALSVLSGAAFAPGRSELIPPNPPSLPDVATSRDADPQTLAVGS
jgi:hypothetical protein